MRDNQEQRDKLQVKQERHQRGENYFKQRKALYEQGVIETDFNTDRRERKKAILEIGVNMSNAKRGKLVVHEGDDPEKICAYFGKAFQLPKTAVVALKA